MTTTRKLNDLDEAVHAAEAAKAKAETANNAAVNDMTAALASAEAGAGTRAEAKRTAAAAKETGKKLEAARAALRAAERAVAAYEHEVLNAQARKAGVLTAVAAAVRMAPWTTQEARDTAVARLHRHDDGCDLPFGVSGGLSAEVTLHVRAEYDWRTGRVTLRCEVGNSSTTRNVAEALAHATLCAAAAQTAAMIEAAARRESPEGWLAVDDEDVAAVQARQAARASM